MSWLDLGPVAVGLQHLILAENLSEKKQQYVVLSVNAPLMSALACSVGFDVLTPVMKSSVVWVIIPNSPLKDDQNFWARCCLDLQVSRVNQARTQHEAKLLSYLTYSSGLKIEATCSSETSVDFEQTTQCIIPEDGTLQQHPSFSKLQICLKF